jgi:hypothetical protein
MVTTIRSGHTGFPEQCPCHVTNAHRMGICWHPRYQQGNPTLICSYLNAVAEKVEPSSRCPLLEEPLDAVRIEMHK